jgi:hypothetical protein
VPLLGETRQLLRRDYQFFLEQGGESLEERRKISGRLAELEADAKHFLLSEAEAAELRGEIRRQVLKVHDADQVAIGALVEAMR